MLSRRIKAVPPYIHSEYLNFKYAPYSAWQNDEGEVVPTYYPWRWLHAFFFRFELPSIKKLYSIIVQKFNSSKEQEARLCFIEPVSIYFDTFPSYMTHEVIPFIWDCWPCYYDKMEKWLNRHKVKTAIFTSRQEMEAMKQRCPHINMFWCPEAVDASLYKEGKPLKDRTIDLLEFGRASGMVGDYKSSTAIKPLNGVALNSEALKPLSNINHICTKVGDKFIFTNEELYSAMGDAKITICLPRSITHPDEAQGIETLTQRYWEAMLSRMIIIGHAPQELIDICGYNPVIEIRDSGLEVKEQVLGILSHIEDYQGLVNKNRRIAIEKADWMSRIQQVKEFLQFIGYAC